METVEQEAKNVQGIVSRTKAYLLTVPLGFFLTNALCWSYILLKSLHDNTDYREIRITGYTAPVEPVYTEPHILAAEASRALLSIFLLAVFSMLWQKNVRQNEKKLKVIGISALLIPVHAVLSFLLLSCFM